MISTKCSTPSTETPVIRTGNLAGNPLPHIPRRTASNSRLPLPDLALSPPPAKSPVTIRIQHATPPEKERQLGEVDTSSSSSDSEDATLTIRPRRSTRSMSATSSQLSPTYRRKRPVQPRCKTDAVKSPKPPLECPSPTPSYSKPPPILTGSIITPPSLVRKKSGQVVRSSLKGSRIAPRPSLSVFTDIGCGPTSKSEPNTPTRTVKFDSQLERVKLFIADQKPVAVSRDGSPTDDTDDSDFPSFIYGTQRTGQRVVIDVVNMPKIPNLRADLLLSSLAMSATGTSVLGNARVRNLAFQKLVVARFTFDNWQTTSEVSARFSEAIDSEFDNFTFTIKLNDLMARIEDRTLHVALRYNVNGGEIWDSNGGSNYTVRFSRTKSVPASVAKEHAHVADLKMKLAKVVKQRDAEDGLKATRLSSRSTSESQLSSSPAVPAPASSRSWVPWYDLATSPNSSQQPQSPSRSRTSTHPSGYSPLPSPLPHQWMTPRATPGSPMPQSSSAADFDGLPFTTPVRRHHHRASWDPSSTRSGIEPSAPPHPPEGYPFPKLNPNFTFPRNPQLVDVPSMQDTDGATSDESTPSLTSPTSGSDRERNSDESPLVHSPTDWMFPAQEGDYSQFLDRFCFFTGGLDADSGSDLSRTSSVSSLGDVFRDAEEPIGAVTPTMSTPRAEQVMQTDIAAMRAVL
ncbi:carbohydrate-binding module family 21 protein [Cylindrobasidium torrendii FP15055 ss-10]|uniref:Carbohydrate-binding module family 21 protein n=1 Tax=Cylindrobasidium torrendii FP15055 ss-10 TaxID=1314674 RepID=A0A0D7AWM9_9AGAR|nr:carbohydrate-binding module family 21 protein [Cylindrobasidium torrendii FP15055 ss-10]